MTLAEQVALVELARDALRADDRNGMAAINYLNQAAAAFPSLVARLREAESLLARADEACIQNGSGMRTQDAIREFLKGRLSP